MSEKALIPTTEADAFALAFEGLRRIAFGPVNDAARLLQLQELTARQIAKLDLFSVTELKLKDNCCEIKLCDRLKALELLAELGTRQQPPPGASSFYAALEAAAKSACDSDAV